MEGEKNIIKARSVNETGVAYDENIDTTAISCCCRGKWHIIVLAVILIIIMLQMSELIKISELLKRADANMR